jgi:uncharacterized protein (DUF58 family)
VNLSSRFRFPDAPVSNGAVALGSRHIYILPTRHGWVFSLVLLALLLAAINYANALAYLLTFLLASMALVSVLHTQRNLLGLTLTVTGTDPVFAGEPAAFHLCARNASGARLAIRVETPDAQLAVLDVPARDTHCVSLTVPAEHRGWLECPAFVLASHYPLGILRAWTRRVRLPARCLVYPRPADAELLSSASAEGGDAARGRLHESDDYAGLRRYQPGDAPTRISWKTLARGQGLFSKDFRAPAGDELWLDWEHYAPHPTEPRLSLLTRAVLEADAAGLRYGLRLPGRVIRPDSGAAQRATCLEALALHALAP